MRAISSLTLADWSFADDANILSLRVRAASLALEETEAKKPKNHSVFLRDTGGIQSDSVRRRVTERTIDRGGGEDEI